MSTFEVTIETITVFPHPNADRLELARVGLYNIVVGKGNWATGDKVLYIPEYAVLPENLIIALDLEGKLSGSKKNRVKPLKLRGALSQGLVAPISFISETLLEERGEKADFADVLNITKWEPEIPVSMQGEMEGNYGLVGWIDIENIKKFPDMFADGELVIVDEKIHGTCTLTTFINPLDENPEVLVSSKGLGAKKFVLKENEGNLYWRMLHKYPIQAFAKQIAESLENVSTVTKVAVFGETFGKGVQDLHYGFLAGNVGFAAFDVFVEYVNETGTHSRWLDADEVAKQADIIGLPVVPRLYEGPFSIEKITELGSGKEQVSGKELHIREGVVIRPVHRPEFDASKKIGKFVSEEYLTRKGTDGQAPTEYN
jgi:RNA ligase (TIGR02306 family)